MKQAFYTAGINGFIEGEGTETLVMVHGWPDTYRVWDQQVAFFKKHYRCVTFILPGFEQQPHKPQAYSLQQVIDAIAGVVDFASPDQPVNLLLHDWGCVFGYQYALQHPQRVAKIIGVDVGDASSPAFVKSITVKQAALIAGYQLPLATAWRIGGSIGNKIARSVAKVLKAPAQPEFIHANMGYPYYIQWTQSYGSYKQIKALKFESPFLYLYGKQKPMMFHSKKWLNQIVQNPQNKVVAFDTSHWIMLEASEQFNQAILSWLQQTTV